MNDQEAIATNGGSGSTHGSFSAIIERAQKETTFVRVQAPDDHYLGGKLVEGSKTRFGLCDPVIRESFQEIIDQHGLKCGISTGWLFKIDEWNIIQAFLHLNGKFFKGLPIVH
jgi:hypothetical protein